MATPEKRPAFDVDLERPSYVGVAGLSGSGKTAMALRLAGQPVETSVRDGVLGSRQYAALMRNRSENVGFVPTDPSLLFSGITGTVIGEIKLSLEILGRNTGLEVGHLDSLADSMDLTPLLNRDPFSLSGGEQMKLALALTLAKRPKLLVLDEIYESLDSDARIHVQHYVESLVHAGAQTAVEFHNRFPTWLSRYDRCVVTSAEGLVDAPPDPLWRWLGSNCPHVLSILGQLALVAEREAGVVLVLPRSAQHLARQMIEKGIPLRLASTDCPRRLSNGRTLLRGTGLTYKYGRSSPFQLGPLDISVREGDVLTLMGPNGAGKTTLCKLLAGVYEPTGGELEATRRNSDAMTQLPPLKRRHHWGASVYYSFQNPDHQLYQPTVRKELQEAARRIQGPGFDAALFEKVVDTLGLRDKLDAGPWDLTRGERRLVALASAFCSGSVVLILDEPTASLDAVQKQSLMSLIHSHSHSGGAVIMVSHDADFILDAGSARLSLVEGRLVETFESDAGDRSWPRGAAPVVTDLIRYLEELGGCVERTPCGDTLGP